MALLAALVSVRPTHQLESERGSSTAGLFSGTYLFTPNLIADAYYGYSRNNPFTAQERLNENLGWTLLKTPGLQSSQAREGGWPALMIDGFGGTGAGQIPEASRTSRRSRWVT